MDTITPKPKVLIIDDDASHRRLAQVIFEKNGFDVLIAQDGSEGVRQALTNLPAIIILDLMMEGLHGFEVCKMLRANQSLRRTAIIIISGKSYKTDVDKAIQLGADAYVVKPFLPKELLEVATLYMNLRASQP
jgi:two-component system, OmpR family, alkaline phosphatase synthesis response regulator PhoP